VQNSSLEIAWTRVVWETNSREGRVLVPFLTERMEGFAIDYEDDWLLAENYLATGRASLPVVDTEPYRE
jgi:N-acylneuraminate cytidylyltransferase